MESNLKTHATKLNALQIELDRETTLHVALIEQHDAATNQIEKIEQHKTSQKEKYAQHIQEHEIKHETAVQATTAALGQVKTLTVEKEALTMELQSEKDQMLQLVEKAIELEETNTTTALQLKELLTKQKNTSTSIETLESEKNILTKQTMVLETKHQTATKQIKTLEQDLIEVHSKHELLQQQQKETELIHEKENSLLQKNHQQTKEEAKKENDKNLKKNQLLKEQLACDQLKLLELQETVEQTVEQIELTKQQTKEETKKEMESILEDDLNLLRGDRDEWKKKHDLQLLQMEEKERIENDQVTLLR